MLSIQEPSAKLTELQPTIKCLSLSAFDTSELKAVREVFRPAARLALGQAWLEREEHDFAPAFVRVGWRGNSLLVFAEVIDFDIFNAATALNQRAWELGDVFEIFLQPTDQPAYVEFQVTPNNQRVQLRFTNAVAAENVRRNGSMESVLIPDEAFFSRTWVQPGACWYVYAEISAEKLFRQAGPLQGRQWRFSFSRYDYTRGREQPVISSTSRHAEPDFHRQPEWGVMSFEFSMP
ncbi:MAG TPA: hypothetical protein VHG71_11115 [Verrucomicrobiae bacterium]|nr:hypothetical protein [Verrucomicrobiae bacterium]